MKKRAERAPRPAKIRKFTSAEVVSAYARARIDGGVPLDYLDGRGATRAIGAAIIDGMIGHSERVENGWLTEKGVTLLDESTKVKYRRAVAGKKLMGAG